MLATAAHVVGYLFSECRTWVVLIRKERPARLRGKWNGPGGRVEPNEQPSEAVMREFHEETGLLISEWNPFATLFRTNGNPVYFFYATASVEVLMSAKTTTDEEVNIWRVADILRVGRCHHLLTPWLMLLALHHPISLIALVSSDIPTIEYNNTPHAQE